MAVSRVLIVLLVAATHSARRKRVQSRDEVASNASTSWSPCAFGMCWKSWGEYSTSPGKGGIGEAGCRRLFSGCPKGSHRMDCQFGPCPKYFGSPACVSTESCRSYCDSRHADSCRYTGPVESSSSSNWMAEFSDVQLNKLLVVEAHHVLARLGALDFRVPTKSDTEILKLLAPLVSLPGLGGLMDIAYASLLPMMSSCQSSDVATLLDRGVRAFDLRPYLSKGDEELHDSHVGKGPLIEEAIAAIGDFVRAHRSEIVYVNVQNVEANETGKCVDCSTGDVYQAIAQLLEKHFGVCGGGTVVCGVDVTRRLKDVLAEGNVIVHSNSDSLVSRLPNMVHAANGQQSIYRASWYDTHSLSELQQQVLGDKNSMRWARNGSTLMGVQWLLTPDKNDFIGTVTQKLTGNWQVKANPHGCEGLACLSEVASAMAFENFFSQVKSVYTRSNFLLLDFADRKGTMEAILRLNRQYARL